MLINQAADAAKSTFDLPVKRHISSRDLIQERFEDFHYNHPEIYRLLVKLARDVKERGYNRYSMKAIWERARWHMHIDKGNRKFTLNNNYHALYARLIMKREDDLKGFFEIRERAQ